MPKKFQTGAGDKIKVFVALLPLGDRTEPVNVTVTTGTGGITAASTTIAVAALSGPIAAGTPLEFSNAGGGKLKVYLSDDAKAADTVLKVETTSGSLTCTCTANYVAKLRLAGGTSTGAKIGNTTTESLVFEDPEGFEDGVVTKANWSIPWNANLLSDDDSYRRIYYAAIHGTSGREVYIWQYDPPPSGYTTGDGLRGACIVGDLSKDFKSDSIVSFTTEFKGQGSPTEIRYA
ncbi:hypothetical protein NDA01_26730 [Trichocoleus desertorum AS-A10]|uniref:hypothetical protein n=1 Tax=Trichocoleus desertorum TaxID=1481672 RepID=UPI003299A94B